MWLPRWLCDWIADGRHDGPTLRCRFVRVEEWSAWSGRRLSCEISTNHTVDEGLRLTADLLFGKTANYLTLHALGDNNTPTADAQTALFGERLRVPFTNFDVDGADWTVTTVLTPVQGNGITFREQGLFTSDGRLYARHVYGDKVKTNLKQLGFTWAGTISR